MAQSGTVNLNARVSKTGPRWLYSTGNLYKAVPRFGEFCFCFCLPLLPQLVCSILTTMYKDFFRALYNIAEEDANVVTIDFSLFLRRTRTASAGGLITMRLNA